MARWQQEGASKGEICSSGELLPGGRYSRFSALRAQRRRRHRLGAANGSGGAVCVTIRGRSLVTS